MCGRFVCYLPAEAAIELFALKHYERAAQLAPRFNIAPSQKPTVIRTSPSGARELVFLQWGLVPRWVKDPKISQPSINARAETIAEKPSFRSAFKSRRCLVPANGFYEWKKHGHAKQPYYVSRDNGAPFAFAGIWERWHTKNEGGNGASHRHGHGHEPLESFSLITQASTGRLTDLHHRQPVTIEPGQFGAWLDASADGSDILSESLRRSAQLPWTIYPVSRQVNTPKNDDASLIEPSDDLEPTA